ncbi:Hypothetical predicted protein [Lecanosticta acicola]|uniref:Uncharacterized protein n=1 Tax=Lecanosticta acicola TaxID=111012 RepID=A0AAI9EE59_9PEZI|nr:Hypothetical predicted protein [Lecanosticta acicola]
MSDPKAAQYQSRAVQEILAQAKKMKGDRSDELRTLEDSLELKQNSTTEQLVDKLLKLVIDGGEECRKLPKMEP